MKAGMNINDLAREVDRLRQVKRDFVIDTREVDFVAGIKPRVVFDHGREAFDVAPHAMSQIQQRLKIPADYFNRLASKHPNLLWENVEYLFKHEPETRMFRTIDDAGNAPIVRAFMSNSYKRIDNEHVLRAAIPVFRKHEKLVFQSTALTPQRMYLKATLPTTRMEVKVGDIVEMGVGLANSEIGLGQVDIYPFVMKLVCMNGARIDLAGYKKRHLGTKIDETGEMDVAYKDDTLRADDRLLELQIRDTIDSILDGPILSKAVESMKQAVDNVMRGSPTAAIKELTKAYSLTSSEGDLIMQHLIRGGDLSQYGLMNAVTAASQDVADYDRATEFETIGGKVLNLTPGEWHETYAYAD